MDNKLQEWTAPRLMRLNHADGTVKHLLGIESVILGNGWITNQGGCELSNSIASAGGGAAVAGGPS